MKKEESDRGTLDSGRVAFTTWVLGWLWRVTLKPAGMEDGCSPLLLDASLWKLQRERILLEADHSIPEAAQQVIPEGEKEVWSAN